MPEYIDKQKLIAKLKKSQYQYIAIPTISLLENTFNENVAPIEHGYWQYTDAYPHWVCCSVCHKRFLPNKEMLERYEIPTNYCPNCGAKMDGKENNKCLKVSVKLLKI